MEALFAHHYYAAKWGASDFYEDAEAELKSALSSGKAFTTGWYGAKKEIHYALIDRELDHGPVSISVRCHMDDGPDLADTAIWSAFGGNDACTCGDDALSKLGLTEEQKERFIDDLMEASELTQEDNYQEDYTQLPADATFEQVVDALDTLSSRLETALGDWYNSTVENAKILIEYVRNGEWQ
jgi:hypothetical protein